MWTLSESENSEENNESVVESDDHIESEVHKADD